MQLSFHLNKYAFVDIGLNNSIIARLLLIYLVISYGSAYSSQINASDPSADFMLQIEPSVRNIGTTFLILSNCLLYKRFPFFCVFKKKNDRNRRYGIKIKYVFAVLK